MSQSTAPSHPVRNTSTIPRVRFPNVHFLYNHRFDRFEALPGGMLWMRWFALKIDLDTEARGRRWGDQEGWRIGYCLNAGERKVIEKIYYLWNTSHLRGSPGYCGAPTGVMRIYGSTQVRMRKHNQNKIHTLIIASIPEYSTLIRLG